MAKGSTRRKAHVSKGSNGNGASKAEADKAQRRKLAKARWAALKPKRVKSLQTFLAAYGSGEEGQRLRHRFAKRVGSTLPYLVHIGYGFRMASPKLATEIEKHTHGLVRVEDMRPDIDWAYLARRIAPPAHAAAAV